MDRKTCEIVQKKFLSFYIDNFVFVITLLKLLILTTTLYTQNYTATCMYSEVCEQVHVSSDSLSDSKSVAIQTACQMSDEMCTYSQTSEYNCQNTNILFDNQEVPEFQRQLPARSTLYIPAFTLPFSSVFFASFSITLLYSRRRGS